MTFWERILPRATKRGGRTRGQCAKDIALAASFVRSLETGDAATNVELRQLALDLERIAGNLSRDRMRFSA